MIDLSRDFFRSHIVKPDPLLSGLDSRLHSAAGSVTSMGSEPELMATARRIDDMSAEWKDLSDGALMSRLKATMALFNAVSLAAVTP